MYRIYEIKLAAGESTEILNKKISEKLIFPHEETAICNLQIVRESVDARDKGDIRFVYTVDFDVKPENAKLMAKKGVKLEKAPDMEYHFLPTGTVELENPPVIAGFGPCGMFAALTLSMLGYEPVVLERGSCMEERIAQVEQFWERGILDTESNVQFGEGGAGTFSDGKLTTGIKDPRIRSVLQEFCNAGASQEILYKQKPHIGTDVLRNIVVNIRKKIIENGGTIRFNTKLEGILTENGVLTGVVLPKGQVLKTDRLILATGHSARDTVRHLYEEGLVMEQKPFSIGVRIEHPQSLINKAQYGPSAEKMNIPADYKLAYHCKNGRGVYTFCMCPGGQVIVASSQENSVVTNGMSMSDRAGKYANSGLLVDVRTTDFESEHPLAGIALQEKYERLAFEKGGRSYKPPTTTWGEFSGRMPGSAAVRESLPEFAVEAMIEAMPQLARRLRGFDSPDAVMTAVETRSSSPFRIIRDDKMQASVEGVMPGGEGAGYAGGIMSAAVDGIKLAEEIAGYYAPRKQR